MHPHTDKETSILRQIRGSIGTRMIGSTEYFQSLIATVVKDGGVGVEDAANMLGCPSFMIESWVSGTDLPEPEECQRLAEKLVALLDEELEFQSLTA